jgi:hypothetical protein
VRALHLLFTSACEDATEILRSRMGDGPFEAAARRGAVSTLEEIAARGLSAVDQLVPATS